MQVHTHIHELPVFTNAVITTGTFDGVHRGHQQIIAQLNAEAAAVQGETVIITFHPHPRTVVNSATQSVSLLNTLAEKTELLRHYGINHLVVIPFTGDFAEMDAGAYIRDFLVDKFHPHTLVTGYDHKFGHNRQGNYQMLEQFAGQYGYVVKEIPAHILAHSAISSTRIRERLLQGDSAGANELLGYQYFFSGKVVQGNQLGRTLGYPTANLVVADGDKLIPASGVYAVTLKISTAADTIYKGMMNIGYRPTIEGTRLVTEVHIFDFDQAIYGETVTVHLGRRLRSEVKFNGLEELKLQLGRDKEAALLMPY